MLPTSASMGDSRKRKKRDGGGRSGSCRGDPTLGSRPVECVLDADDARWWLVDSEMGEYVLTEDAYMSDVSSSSASWVDARGGH
jgi:hypothetical protein